MLSRESDAFLPRRNSRGPAPDSLRPHCSAVRSSHGGDDGEQSSRRPCSNDNRGRDVSVSFEADDDLAPEGGGLCRAPGRLEGVWGRPLRANTQVSERPPILASESTEPEVGLRLSCPTSRGHSVDRGTTRQTQDSLLAEVSTPAFIPGQLPEAGKAPAEQLRGAQCGEGVPELQGTVGDHVLEAPVAGSIRNRTVQSRVGVQGLQQAVRTSSPVWAGDSGHSFRESCTRESFYKLVRDDELAGHLTDWTEEDLETFAEDCPSLRDSAIPLPSLETERLFTDGSGRLYLYVPESTGTYVLGSSLREGWLKYKLGRTRGWSKIAQRVHPESGEMLADCAGLEIAYSGVVLQNEDLGSLQKALESTEKKLQSLGLVVEKEAGLANIGAILRQEELEHLQSIFFVVTDTGIALVEKKHLGGKDEARLTKLFEERLSMSSSAGQQQDA